MKVSNIFVLFTILLVRSSSSLNGSCRASRKCCDGKDTDCAVQKADLNSIIMDLSDEPCYCDHGCLEMGDCCPDFKEFCGGKISFKFRLVFVL